jgi:hypothetical protein
VTLGCAVKGEDLGVACSGVYPGCLLICRAF